MRIFLTGATGLLGGAVAGALLDAGHDVTALVRDRAKPVTDMDGRGRSGEIDTIVGDIALPGFGMADPSVGIDLVLHCAAVTDFDAKPEVHRAVNIDGTAHAVDVARQCNCPLLHVSTAYVCGRRDGWIGESPVEPGHAFSNGYEASKAEAEALVMAAQAEGLRIAIARPSVILGRMADGAIRVMDNFYNMFRLVGDGALGAIPVADGAAFNFVPIDHVVAALLHMAGNMADFEGKTVHLVARNATPMAALVEAIAAYPGATPSPLVPPERFDASALDRRQRILQRRIGRLYFEYFLRSPQFEAERLAAKGGPAAPVLVQDDLLRMIDFCVETGFVGWGRRKAA